MPSNEEKSASIKEGDLVCYTASESRAGSSESRAGSSLLFNYLEGKTGVVMHVGEEHDYCKVFFPEAMPSSDYVRDIAGFMSTKNEILYFMYKWNLKVIPKESA